MGATSFQYVTEVGPGCVPQAARRDTTSAARAALFTVLLLCVAGKRRVSDGGRDTPPRVELHTRRVNVCSVGVGPRFRRRPEGPGIGTRAGCHLSASTP